MVSNTHKKLLYFFSVVFIFVALIVFATSATTISNSGESVITDTLFAPLGLLTGNWSNVTITLSQISNLINTDDLPQGIVNFYNNNSWNESRADGLYLKNIVEDLTPQLGGDLDANGFDIGNTTNEIQNVYISNNSRIFFGDGQEASMYFDGTVLIVEG